MKASLKVILRDTPGQLRKALEVFENVNANVISVMHVHGEKVGDEVPVEIIFGIPDREALQRMEILLRESGWKVLSIGKIVQLSRITVGIIGHIIGTKSFEEMITKVDELGANVCDFSIRMPAKNIESSALLTFESENNECTENAISEIGKLCEKNGLLLIKPVS